MYKLLNKKNDEIINDNITKIWYTKSFPFLKPFSIIKYNSIPNANKQREKMTKSTFLLILNITTFY